jgi:hypothetical protein
MGFFNNFAETPGALPPNMPPAPAPKRAPMPMPPPAAQMPIKDFPPPPVQMQATPDKKKDEEVSIKREEILVKRDDPRKNPFEEFFQNNIEVPDELPDLEVPKPTGYFKELPGFREIPAFELGKEERDILPLHDTKELLELKKDGPLYIRTDDYSQIMSHIDTIAGYIQESPGMIYVLHNLKKNMDLEHKNYARLLEDIQRKLIYIDNMMFESMRDKI